MKQLTTEYITGNNIETSSWNVLRGFHKNIEKKKLRKHESLDFLNNLEELNSDTKQNLKDWQLNKNSIDKNYNTTDETQPIQMIGENDICSKTDNIKNLTGNYKRDQNFKDLNINIQGDNNLSFEEKSNNKNGYERNDFMMKSNIIEKPQNNQLNLIKKKHSNSESEAGEQNEKFNKMKKQLAEAKNVLKNLEFNHQQELDEIK